MMNVRILRLFFFQEATVTSHSYLDMLEHYTVPQLPCDAWFHLEGEPQHFGYIALQFVN
jgi:hypothetical protein